MACLLNFLSSFHMKIPGAGREMKLCRMYRDGAGTAADQAADVCLCASCPPPLSSLVLHWSPSRSTLEGNTLEQGSIGLPLDLLVTRTPRASLARTDRLSEARQMTSKHTAYHMLLDCDMDEERMRGVLGTVFAGISSQGFVQRRATPQEPRPTLWNRVWHSMPCVQLLDSP